MKPIELWSTLVAGLAGAVLFYSLDSATASPPPGQQALPAARSLPLGFAVGAGVQITVRLLGVS